MCFTYPSPWYFSLCWSIKMSNLSILQKLSFVNSCQFDNLFCHVILVFYNHKYVILISIFGTPLLLIHVLFSHIHTMLMIYYFVVMLQTKLPYITLMLWPLGLSGMFYIPSVAIYQPVLLVPWPGPVKPEVKPASHIWNLGVVSM